jgi:ribosomal silencing factor RsfS
MDSFEMMKTAVKALDSKKGIDIKVLEIKHISTLADYLVSEMVASFGDNRDGVCSCACATHVKFILPLFT